MASVNLIYGSHFSALEAIWSVSKYGKFRRITIFARGRCKPVSFFVESINIVVYTFPPLKKEKVYQLLLFSHDTLNLRVTLGFEHFCSPISYVAADGSGRFRLLSKYWTMVVIPKPLIFPISSIITTRCTFLVMSDIHWILPYSPQWHVQDRISKR